MQVGEFKIHGALAFLLVVVKVKSARYSGVAKPLARMASRAARVCENSIKLAAAGLAFSVDLIPHAELVGRRQRAEIAHAVVLHDFAGLIDTQFKLLAVTASMTSSPKTSTLVRLAIVSLMPSVVNTFAKWAPAVAPRAGSA